MTPAQWRSLSNAPLIPQALAETASVDEWVAEVIKHAVSTELFSDPHLQHKWGDRNRYRFRFEDDFYVAMFYCRCDFITVLPLLGFHDIDV